MNVREKILDPVDAYDRIAAVYPRLAEARTPYLAAIDELIISRVPAGSESLLDVGAGNGKRACQIAERAAIQEVVLLEPSAGMRAAVSSTAEIWPVRVEELGEVNRQFDVITCLWNVLGHTSSTEARMGALSKLRRMLSPKGRMFIDVNHRYNAGAYGWFRTAGRWVYDNLERDNTHGDVIARWDVDGVRCATHGHVFTDREFRRLIVSAGLDIQERVVVDYGTGQIRRFGFAGNLFYALAGMNRAG